MSSFHFFILLICLAQGFSPVQASGSYLNSPAVKYEADSLLIQFRIDSFKLKINEYQQNQVFDQYYETLRAFEKWCLDVNRFGKYNWDSYYMWLPQNLRDSSIFRKATMYHGNKLKKSSPDLFKALKYYDLAHTHGAHVSFDDKWSWYVENTMGNIYSQLNNYDKAIYYYLLCVNTKSGQKRLSRLFKNIGSAYLWLEDHESGVDYLQRALSYLDGKDDQFTYISIQIKLMEIHLLQKDYGNFDLLSKEVSDLLKLTLRDEKSDVYRVALKILIGDYHLQKGRPNDSNEAYVEAIRIKEESQEGFLDRSVAKLYVKMAANFLTEKDYKACFKSVRKGYEAILPNFDVHKRVDVHDIYLENTLEDLLLLEAECLVQSKSTEVGLSDLNEALRLCSLARKSHDLLLTSILAGDSKRAMMDDNKNIIDLAIRYAYSAYEKSGEEKYAIQLREYFAYSKGRALIYEKIRSQLFNNLDGKSGERYEHLKRMILEHQIKILSDGERVDFYTLLEELNQLYLDEIESDSSLAKLSDPFIEYVVTQKEVYLYTNLAERHFWKLSLEGREIKNMIEEVKIGVIGKEEGNDNLLLKLCDELIPFQLADLNSLIIVPDGFLAAFPFELLRTGNGYLIEELAISYRYYNGELINDAIPRSGKLRTLCLFPEYQSIKGDLVSEERSDLLPLAYANEELDALKGNDHFDVECLESTDIQILSQRLDSCEIFHFGGHAIANVDRPYLSLMDEEGLAQRIYVSQIAQMDNALSLVCLSACETGLGKIVEGEGVRSLASSFFSAGSTSVVYSLWPVNDKSTANLMNKFYKYLGKGMKLDQALRKAKMDYLGQASPSERHPYYWSAFCIMGDTAPLLNGKETSIYLLTCLFLLFLVLTIILLKWKTNI